MMISTDNFIAAIRKTDAAFVAWQADRTNRDLECDYEETMTDLRACRDAWEDELRDACYTEACP